MILRIMNDISIDLETATLSAPKSQIVKLKKQLAFIEDRYRNLLLQVKNNSLLFPEKKVHAISSAIHNLLRDELKEDYTGVLESDVLKLELKLTLERNEYQHMINQSHKTIEMLGEQCVNMQNDVDEKENLLKQTKHDCKRLNQDLQFTIFEMNNQIKYHCQMKDCSDKNITASVNDSSSDTFVHDAAIQTDVFENSMNSSIETDCNDHHDTDITDTASIFIQTELSAYDVMTVEQFDALMIQNQNGLHCDTNDHQHTLVISPLADTLQLELDSFKFKAIKREKRFSFGNELFSRTQLRMEKRRQYNQQKNERMNKKSQKPLQRLRMHRNKNNPFRCTKVTKNN